jgi:hypothetical protein
MARLEDVFRLSGLPTHTFVEPARYQEIKISIRTPGRCCVIEGPSGIGKTTTVLKVLEELGLRDQVLSLSARRPEDAKLIAELPSMKDIGTVIVDDFHRLSDETKAGLSDFMKLLAEADSDKSKLILIGINKAGQQLVRYAYDLGMRIDVFKLEANPTNKIEQLITQGEAALKVVIAEKIQLARRAQGSYQIAQLLCHKICILGQIYETALEQADIGIPVDAVIEEVMGDLARQFREAAMVFARGSKLRREGRAPYLHILRWLADSDEWSLDLSEALNTHPDQKASIVQVLDKGYLAALLNDTDKRTILEPHFHFEPSTSILSVEDPKLIFYLKNIVWRWFTRQVGFRTDVFEYKYDFALSFAGADRAHAKRLAELLGEREVAVFFDEHEQHRILAANIEEYLGPIYRSEARYVIPFLSPDYPTRIWTKVESDNFKERFGSDAVIPVRFTTAKPGYFSDEHKYGGLFFDPLGDAEPQLTKIADTLCKRIVDDREMEAAAAKGEG